MLFHYTISIPIDYCLFETHLRNWRGVKVNKIKEGAVSQFHPVSHNFTPVYGTFSGLLAKALLLGEDTGPANLIKGFEKCGLYPVNCNRVLDSLPNYARSDTSVIRNVGTEFKKYLETMRQTDLNVKVVRKYRLPIEAGKSVSADDVRAFYMNKENSSTCNGKRKQRQKEREEESGTGGDVTLLQPGTPKLACRTRRTVGVNNDGGSVNTCNETDMPIYPTNNQEILAELSVNSIMPYQSEDVNNSPVVIAEGNTVVEEGLLLHIINKSPSEGDFKVSDHVIAVYEGKCYPGRVTAVEVRGSVISYRVSCMIKKGKHWVWPEREDEVWYGKDNILK